MLPLKNGEVPNQIIFRSYVVLFHYEVLEYYEIRQVDSNIQSGGIKKMEDKEELSYSLHLSNDKNKSKKARKMVKNNDL